MALEEDIRTLRAAPLLSGIPIEGLRLLAFSAESRGLQPGDTLFRAGEDASCGYVLVSGALTLQFGSRPPKRVAGQGCVIEELALFCETGRHSTARADGPARVLQLPRSAFIRMLGEYPHCAATLHAYLSGRLREDAADRAAVGQTLDALGGARPA